MQPEFFDFIPMWALPAVLVGMLTLAMELGYRVGKWRHAKFPDERDQPVGAIVASILGLLALVLAFTFNLAASRYEARRQTILEEANAIGTTYLRAATLPAPERAKSAQLLREYVRVRVAGVRDNQIDAMRIDSEKLQSQLWTQAVSAAERDPHSITTGLYMQSLNSLIDLHAKRILVGIRNRIPAVIWAALLGLAVVGMTAVGYQSALAATRRSPAMLALVLAFAGVVYLIADLDRVQQGLVRVSQQAMLDVQKSIGADAR